MTDEEALKKLLGIDRPTADKMRADWEALPIEWHCPGRHGVVRNVPAKDAGHIQRVINWHLGDGACRWTKTENGVRSVEFVHMAKVFPPPKRPWQWCGETVLFQDWKDHEAHLAKAGKQFRPGDRVSFVPRDQRRRHGIVASVNAKSISVVVAGEGRWRVSPDWLDKDAS